MANLPIEIDFKLQRSEFSLAVRARITARPTGLYGHSCAGKSTVLQTIAGLITPSEGIIRVGDRTLFDSYRGINVPASERRAVYIAQNDVGLHPHLNVYENLLCGVRQSRQTESTSSAKLKRLLGLLEISSLLKCRVPELSASESQRVALARALLSDPSVLLFDEPLVALDRTRTSLIPYLRRALDGTDVSLMFVTHNVAEHEALAQSVIALERGRVIWVGPPQGLSGLSNA